MDDELWDDMDLYAETINELEAENLRLRDRIEGLTAIIHMIETAIIRYKSMVQDDTEAK